MARKVKAMPDEEPAVGAPRTFTVTVDPDTDQAEVRNELETALGTFPVSGFRINTRDRPCPTCGRMQRTSTGSATVTISSNEPDADLFDRLADALGDKFVGDLRGGSA
jgi:hypothetical protein